MKREKEFLDGVNSKEILSSPLKDDNYFLYLCEEGKKMIDDKGKISSLIKLICEKYSKILDDRAKYEVPHLETAEFFLFIMLCLVKDKKLIKNFIQSGIEEIIEKTKIIMMNIDPHGNEEIKNIIEDIISKSSVIEEFFKYY